MALLPGASRVHLACAACRPSRPSWHPCFLAAALLQTLLVPLPLPGSQRLLFPLAPEVTAADELAVANMVKVADFLLGGQAARLAGSGSPAASLKLAQELGPFLPALAYEILPQVHILVYVAPHLHLTFMAHNQSDCFLSVPP